MKDNIVYSGRSVKQALSKLASMARNNRVGGGGDIWSRRCVHAFSENNKLGFYAFNLDNGCVVLTDVSYDGPMVHFWHSDINRLARKLWTRDRVVLNMSKDGNLEVLTNRWSAVLRRTCEEDYNPVVPDLNEVPWITISHSRLIDLVPFVRSMRDAVAGNDKSIVLTPIYVDIETKIATAADGYRAARIGLHEDSVVCDLDRRTECIKKSWPEYFDKDGEPITNSKGKPLVDDKHPQMIGVAIPPSVVWSRDVEIRGVKDGWIGLVDNGELPIAVTARHITQCKPVVDNQFAEFMLDEYVFPDDIATASTEIFNPKWFIDALSSFSDIPSIASNVYLVFSRVGTFLYERRGADCDFSLVTSLRLSIDRDEVSFNPLFVKDALKLVGPCELVVVENKGGSRSGFTAMKLVSKEDPRVNVITMGLHCELDELMLLVDDLDFGRLDILGDEFTKEDEEDAKKQ